MPNQLINTPVSDYAQPQYQRYGLETNYSYDAGLLVLPVAGPDGSPPRVIKTHAVIGYKEVDAKAIKNAAPPVLPQLGSNSSQGDIFLNGNLHLPLPYLNNNQNSFIFSGEGKYRYVQPSTPQGYKANDVFYTGVYPFELPNIQFLASYDMNDTINNTGQWTATSKNTSQPYDLTRTSQVWYSTSWLSTRFFSPTIV